MKAVDTNVLVRLFVDDSTDQPRRAQARFLVARRDRQPLHVPDIVLVESTSPIAPCCAAHMRGGARAAETSPIT